MIKKNIIVIFLVIAVFFAFTVSAETVKFEGISGTLGKPSGNGPFPAIVLLHACKGITPRYDAWIDRFVSWNYVTLMVDSFRSRGIRSDCAHPISLTVKTRVHDAYAAKSYLANRDFVDPSKIAVIGWSYGGVTTTYTVTTAKEVPNSENPFRAGIALYPGCHKISASLNAPLLILIGEKDDWTYASKCKALKKRLLKKKTEHELVLKIYPNTHHGFDIEDMDINYRGHVLKYNPEAAANAIAQIKAFLAKHLK